MFHSVNNRKGFTIIELLVVIAIIGILTSVVLGSLSDARDEGLAAKVKSEMSALSKRVAIEESQALTYDVVCGSNGVPQAPQIITIIESIERFAPLPVSCNSDTEMYAVSAALSTSSFWCVDSQGASKEIGAALSTTSPEFVCP